MGSIIGDLNGRRGQVMGVEQVGKRQVIQGFSSTFGDAPFILLI